MWFRLERLLSRSLICTNGVSLGAGTEYPLELQYLQARAWVSVCGHGRMMMRHQHPARISLPRSLELTCEGRVIRPCHSASTSSTGLRTRAHREALWHSPRAHSAPHRSTPSSHERSNPHVALATARPHTSTSVNGGYNTIHHHERAADPRSPGARAGRAED